MLFIVEIKQGSTCKTSTINLFPSPFPPLFTHHTSLYVDDVYIIVFFYPLIVFTEKSSGVATRSGLWVFSAGSSVFFFFLSAPFIGFNNS